MIDRVHDDWSGLTVIPVEDLEALDVNAAKALDGVGGGGYSPSAAVVVGGGGIMDANATVHAISSTVATETVSNVTAHRLRVTGGIYVTSKLEVQFAAGGDGEKRELFVDYLPAGTALSVRGEGGASIGNGLFVAPRNLEFLSVTIERTDGAWRMAARSSAPDKSGFTTLVSPTQSPAVNTHMLAEYVYVQTLSGTVIFQLPDPTDVAGARRRLRIGNIIGTSGEIIFKEPDGTTVFSYPTIGKEINTLFEFVASGGTWLLWDLRRNVRFVGARVATASGQVISIDTDKVEILRALSAVGPNDISNSIVFTIKPPLFEGQELEIHFDNFDTAAVGAQVVFLQEGDSQAFHRYFPSQQAKGSGPRTFRLKVIGTLWRWMGEMR